MTGVGCEAKRSRDLRFAFAKGFVDDNLRVAGEVFVSEVVLTTLFVTVVASAFAGKAVLVGIANGLFFRPD